MHICQLLLQKHLSKNDLIICILIFHPFQILIWTNMSSGGALGTIGVNHNPYFVKLLIKTLVFEWYVA